MADFFHYRYIITAFVSQFLPRVVFCHSSVPFFLPIRSHFSHMFFHPLLPLNRTRGIYHVVEQTMADVQRVTAMITLLLADQIWSGSLNVPRVH
jgi:hypothetical protein